MNVLIAEDHPLYRSALKDFVEKSGLARHVMAVENGKQALALIKMQSFDIVIADITMPEMSGTHLFEEVLQLPIKPKFIFNSADVERAHIISYFNSGFLNGYFTKNTSTQELSKGLKVIAEGGVYYCENLHKTIVETHLGWELVQKPKEKLTVQEQRVLIGICEQLTNHEIARRLLVSEHTVKNHRKHLKKKLNIDHTAGLIVYAIKEGLFKVLY